MFSVIDCYTSGICVPYELNKKLYGDTFTMISREIDSLEGDALDEFDQMNTLLWVHAIQLEQAPKIAG